MIVFHNHIKFHMSLNDWFPPPPQWGIPILISKAFSWIDDADLCNWAHICSWALFHFNISHQTIWFRENLKNSAYVPFPLTGFWSAKMTESLTFTFLLCALLFFRGMSWGRTSLFHLFQKATTIFWQNSSRWCGFSMWRNGPLGTLLVAVPSMMSFGHKQAPSSGSFGILPMGRSFNRFATSRRQV